MESITGEEVKELAAFIVEALIAFIAAMWALIKLFKE